MHSIDEDAPKAGAKVDKNTLTGQWICVGLECERGRLLSRLDNELVWRRLEVGRRRARQDKWRAQAEVLGGEAGCRVGTSDCHQRRGRSAREADELVIRRAEWRQTMRAAVIAADVCCVLRTLLLRDLRAEVIGELIGPLHVSRCTATTRRSSFCKQTRKQSRMGY